MNASPVHLLTRETFEIYWTHLKADGILAGTSRTTA